MSDNELIVLSELIPSLSKEYYNIKREIEIEQEDSLKQKEKLNELQARLEKLSENIDVDLELPKREDNEIVLEVNASLTESIKDILDIDDNFKDETLEKSEIIVASVAGIIAIFIDVFLVGIPNIENKLNKDNKLNRSILSEAITNILNSKLAPVLKKLEGRFTVPYDKSYSKDGLSSTYHRLRSFSHDPFLGLFFSFFDFVFKTTTYINNRGLLVIAPYKTKSYKPIKLYQSVYWFMGHLLSDFSTKRGLPVPGFVLTQLFTSENFDLSEKARKMYFDGYDLRHLASMSVPTGIKTMIIDVYLNLTKDESSYSQIDKEILSLNNKIKNEKMRLIANSISVGGNVVKFLSPPSSGNPASLNTIEWYSFIKSSVINYNINKRDTETEKILSNRETINLNWEKLLND